MSKILKAGTVTLNTEKFIYAEAVKAAVEDYDNVLDVEDIPEEDFEATPELTPEQQAEETLEQARREAETIINDAKQKAEKEAETISDQAWEQGYQEGMDLASSEGDAIRAQAQKVLLDAEEERRQIINSLEPEIIELIIGITGKLIDDSIRINPKIITVLIKRGLSGTNLTGEIFIHVSPQDYDAVMEDKAELFAVMDSSTRLEIIKDQSLNPMDCIIETPFGSVDCSLNAGYELLEQSLRYILNGKKS